MTRREAAFREVLSSALKDRSASLLIAVVRPGSAPRCGEDRAEEARHMKDSLWVVLLSGGVLFVIAYDLFSFVVR